MVLLPIGQPSPPTQGPACRVVSPATSHLCHRTVKVATDDIQE